MARNVEIKARIPNVAAIEQPVAAIADYGPDVIVQDDTFFSCSTGRLKLRVFSGEDGELIFYRRRDTSEPTESYYLRLRTDDPLVMREMLSQAFGEEGSVRKRRLLYRVGRTRVHLDSVEGLGDFLELEVVLEDGESVEAGVEEARRLMATLGIQDAQLIRGSYVDLPARRTTPLGP